MTGACTRPHSAQHTEPDVSGSMNADVAGGSPAAAMRRNRVPRRTAACSQSGSCGDSAPGGVPVDALAGTVAASMPRAAPGTLFVVPGVGPADSWSCDGASQLGLAWRSGRPISPRFSGCGTCFRCDGSRCCSAVSDGWAGQ
ncbi:hypothetical protein D3C72_1091240 [compost metagenome]